MLLAPVVLAPIAVAMGLDVVILRLGLPEEVAVVLVLSVFALPYTTFTMRATYLALDPALEEQARVLGASARGALRRVTLPAAATGLVTATGLAFLVGWSDYAVTLLIGGGQIVTAPMLIGSSAGGSGNDALTSTLAVSASLPPLVAVAVFTYAALTPQEGGARMSAVLRLSSITHRHPGAEHPTLASGRPGGPGR